MHWLDPSVLPVVEGIVGAFTINAHGDVDGVLLDHDRQVHVPPHMGDALARLVAVGDRLSARYVKPRAGRVFAAVRITGPSGETLDDPGPPPKHARPRKKPLATRPVRIEGRVRVTLLAPKGEVAGAILDDGTQVRFDAKMNADLAPDFAKGRALVVEGDAFERDGTKVVDLAEVASFGDSEVVGA